MPKKTQCFFLDHTDEVLCIDQHPSRALVASSQKGRLPKVSEIRPTVRYFNVALSTLCVQSAYSKYITIAFFIISKRTVASMPPFVKGADLEHRYHANNEGAGRLSSPCGYASKIFSKRPYSSYGWGG